MLDNGKPIRVIGTSVIMGIGPRLIDAYRNCNIVFPMAVIEELEKHRGDGAGMGWACRSTLNAIGRLRAQHPGRALFRNGIEDGNGNTILIAKTPTSYECPDARDLLAKGDCSSIAIAVAIAMGVNGTDNVVLVSNSLPTQLQAGNYGVTAESFGNDSYQSFSGWFTLVNDDHMPTDDQVIQAIDRLSAARGHKVPANAAVEINCGNSQTYKLKSCTELTGGTLVDNLVDVNFHIMAGGVKPRNYNLDQTVALNYLMNKEIQVVSLGGVAGSGKSLLALAAGIAQTAGSNVDRNRDKPYERIIVFRSMVEVAQQQIGFLPGDLDDKMAPWAQAVWDNVRQIDKINGNGKYAERGLANASSLDRQRGGNNRLPAAPTDLAAVSRCHENISVQPVTYLRGRTFVNSFIIVDDAQSLDRSTLLDIISRMGKGSKIVFTYDMSQQDNRYISLGTSIVSVVNDLLEQPVFAHMDFTKSERSPLAQLAADLLARDN